MQIDSDFERSKKKLEKGGFRIDKRGVYAQVVPLDNSFSIGRLDENGNFVPYWDSEQFKKYHDKIKGLGIVML
jgi:hypothetical protein